MAKEEKMRLLNNGLFRQLWQIQRNNKGRYRYYWAASGSGIQELIRRNTREKIIPIVKAKQVELYRRILFPNKKIHCKNKRRRNL